MGKWLIPRLGLGKHKMSIENPAVPAIKKVLRTLAVKWLRFHAPKTEGTS